MCCRRVAVALALLLAGCQRSANDGYRRLAIPAFENLTGDNSMNWWGVAAAELAAAAATGAARTHPLRVESWWDAPAVRATHVLHGSLLRRGPRLRLEAALEDLALRRIERSVVLEEPAASSPAVLADRLAAELGLRVRRVAHYNAEAVRAYAQAYAGADPAGLLEQAIAADASFGLPYLQLVRLRLGQGDRGGAEAVLTAARRAGLEAVEQSRLALIEAGFRGDAGAYARSLEALARLTPADPDILQALAVRALAARKYAQASQHYREALARDPDNPVLLNQAGYTLTYAGEFDQAVKFLLRYRDLQPGDPNPADSLGDIYFQTGNFAQAETYYGESSGSSPEFAAGGSLFKGAWARWLRGDRQGADQSMAEYFRQREAARDPLLELRRGQWEYLTGRSERAVERVRRLAGGGEAGELQALAFGFLAAWSLERGDREQARRFARAASGGASPQARELGRICLFLSGAAASPAEWTRQAEQGFARPEEAGLRQTALAHALLLGGHFREALPVLSGLLQSSPPSPSEVLPVLLAWAASESGQDPTEWLRRWPVPGAGMPQPFDFLVWPRVLYLHGVGLERQGAGEQARAFYRLFVSAVGDRPGHDRERSRAAGKAGG